MRGCVRGCKESGRDLPDASYQPDVTWRDRRIIVAVTGGIACYKSASLVSKLVQAGADVRVLMTRGARRFVEPLTFETLSGHKVTTSVWHARDNLESQHVADARWCDLLIIAPATADIIARLAAGICDDVVCLTAAALSRDTPVLLAPAMNAQMWQSPITQRNLTTLRDMLGYNVVGPEEGWQACRTAGAGRMSEPEAIVERVADLISRI